MPPFLFPDQLQLRLFPGLGNDRVEPVLPALDPLAVVLDDDGGSVAQDRGHIFDAGSLR